MPKKQEMLPEAILKQLESMSNPGLAGTDDQSVSDERSTCTICQANKVRKHDTECKAKCKRYFDEQGRYWRGKKCPDCVKIEHRNYMREKRGTRHPRV